jgi:hypothetical protein
MSNLYDLDQLVLIFFVRLVWLASQQHCVSCISATPTGTVHSSRRIMRGVCLSICLSTSITFGSTISRVLVLHSIQCPDQIVPAEARPLICFDMVRNSAWGCGCNHHHDYSCNARRVFVHPDNLKQHISPIGYLFSLSLFLALILGIAQFFISIGATLLFRIMPSSRMFGDRVTSKSCKYLTSQTFMASYLILIFPIQALAFCDPELSQKTVQ